MKQNKRMTFEEYNQETIELAKKVGGHLSYGENIVYPILALNEEAGEVAGVLKKAMRTEYDKVPSFRNDKRFGGNYEEFYFNYITSNKEGRKVREKLILELGDVLWYLNRCAEEIGASLEEIADRNISKLKKRIKEGTTLSTSKRSED